MDIAAAALAIDHHAKQLGAHMATLNKRLSATDQELNDITHVLEYIPLNAAEMIQLCVRQKQLLIVRRLIKEDIAHAALITASPVSSCGGKAVNPNALKRRTAYIQEARKSYERLLKKVRAWPTLA
jgi:hypothetical protein